MPNTALKSAQFGQEGSTYGAVVAATAKLAAVSDAEIVWQPDNRGIPEMGRMSPSPSAAQVSRRGAGSIKFIPTYEQLIYLGHAYFGSVSASGTSGGGQFNWTYSAPTTASETPTVFTLEFGAPNAVKRLTGAVGSKFKLGLEAGGFWSGEMEFLGKDVSSTGGALTALSDVSVNLLKAAHSVLYVDTSGGTIGSTTLASVLIKADLEVDTKRHLKLFAGTTTPSNYGTDQWTGTLKTMLEYTTAVQDIIDANNSGLVERQIQITTTFTTNYVSVLQFTGFITGDIPHFADRDGNVAIEVTWQGKYNSAFANWLKLKVTNASSALT